MIVRIRSRAALAVAGVAVVAGALSVATAAGAAPVPEGGRSGFLRLDADPYPADNLSIARGERLLWPVTAELEAPSAGELSVRVESAEPLAESADGLRFRLVACAEPWTLPADPDGIATCGSAEEVIVADEAFATTTTEQLWELGAILPGVPRYFLITLSLPLSTPGAIAAEPAELAFGFTARELPGPSTVAATGATAAGPLLVAAGLLLGGMVLVRVRSGEVPE
jgi:hypothetical protein